jgi:hypothetical protein
LSLREHKVVLSKMLHQENAKLAHKKRLEAEAEHRALAILRKQHPFEPLVKLEHQYRTEKVEAQRRAREHHAAEERELLARKRALERKLHPKKFEAEEKAAAEVCVRKEPCEGGKDSKEPCEGGKRALCDTERD